MHTRTMLWAAACAALMSVPSTAMFGGPKSPRRTADAASIPRQTADPDFSDRATLIAALERLMTTGEPADTSHDDGQLLQWAVDAAIARGDAEIERLAVRAAAPTVPGVRGPVSAIDNLPTFGVSSRPVLKVPRPVPYVAVIYVSIDGSPFMRAGEVRTGVGWGERIDPIFGPAARTPGVHHVRSRAYMTFGAAGAPQWNETRELPDVSYALYDWASRDDAVRAFVDAPRTISARALDPLLPDVPVGRWLGQLAAPRNPPGADHTAPPPAGRVDWQVQFCAERTSESGHVFDTGDLCAVAYMEAAGDIERAWFRTATVRRDGNGLHWEAVPVTLEGINMAQSGAEARTLSELGTLIASDRRDWPTGDVSITPEDILITPLTADGRTAHVSITARNLGRVDLHGVELHVTATGDPLTAKGPLPSRILVIDIPAMGDRTVTLDVSLPPGTGVVAAHALQAGEHAPHDTFSSDPTPENACAFRIVNPKQAPPDLAAAVAGLSGCRGW